MQRSHQVLRGARGERLRVERLASCRSAATAFGTAMCLPARTFSGGQEALAEASKCCGAARFLVAPCSMPASERSRRQRRLAQSSPPRFITLHHMHSHCWWSCASSRASPGSVMEAAAAVAAAVVVAAARRWRWRWPCHGIFRIAGMPRHRYPHDIDGHDGMMPSRYAPGRTPPRRPELRQSWPGAVHAFLVGTTGAL